MRNLLAALVVVGLVSSICEAQEGSRVLAAPAFQEGARPIDVGQKLFLGASAGLGNSSPNLCDGCRTGLDIGLRGGVIVRPRLALQLEGQFLSVAPNILSKSGAKHDALLGSVQFWPASWFWIKGGAGVGSVERHTQDSSTRSSHPAGVGGVGFDFRPRSRFGFDVSVQALVSGDSETPTAAPGDNRTTTTTIVRFGVTWRAR